MALNSPGSPTQDKTRNNTTNELKMNVAMSEASSIHNDRLYSIARELSGMGLDAFDYMEESSHSVVNNFLDGMGHEPGKELYFADGKRKVDYVLVYRVTPVVQDSPGQHRLSVISNGSFPQAGSKEAETVKEDNAEVVVDMGPTDPAECDKLRIREEFETHLREAGLHIERDNEHKVYGQGFVRLHAPWQVLSREAEFLKIKVPTKKSYDLKEEKGLSATMNTVWRKLNQPFQPNIPHLHQQSRTKFLSHSFSRDKLHL